jgi:hypothetical protein
MPRFCVFDLPHSLASSTGLTACSVERYVLYFTTGTFHRVDAMSDQVSERVAAADAAILATFRSDPVQYPALIASRSGLHIPYAERRCRVLADRGLLEQVSGEIAYRLTTDVRHYLSDSE